MACCQMLAAANMLARPWPWPAAKPQDRDDEWHDEHTTSQSRLDNVKGHRVFFNISFSKFRIFKLKP